MRPAAAVQTRCIDTVLFSSISDKTNTDIINTGIIDIDNDWWMEQQVLISSIH